MLALTGAEGAGSRAGRQLRSVSRQIGSARSIELASDIALQAADDFAFGLTLRGALRRVSPGAGAIAQADEHDPVQRAVGLTVAARVQAMSLRAPGGRLEGCGAAEPCEGGLARQPSDVLAGGDKQLRGVHDADTGQCEGAGRDPLHKWPQRLVEIGNLAVQLGDVVSDAAQRELRGL